MKRLSLAIIFACCWDENGTKTQQTLKWNDGRFSY